MASRWLDDTLTPPPNLGRARPFEVAELDDHVDGARIWATILEAREEVSFEMRDEYERGEEAGAEEAKEEIDELNKLSKEALLERIAGALDDLKKSYTKANLEALEAIINEG